MATFCLKQGSTWSITKIFSHNFAMTDFFGRGGVSKAVVIIGDGLEFYQNQQSEFLRSNELAVLVASLKDGSHQRAVLLQYFHRNFLLRADCAAVSVISQ